MKKYKNIEDSSGVTRYEEHPDRIVAEFNNKSRYLYTYSRTGKRAVEKGKLLANEGKGLSIYRASRSGKNLQKNSTEMINPVEALGLAAALLTTIANVPQAIKVIKTHSVKSLSAVTYSLLFTGMVLWVIYGVIKNDLPIILANAIAAALCGIILFMKLWVKYRPGKQ